MVTDLFVAHKAMLLRLANAGAVADLSEAKGIFIFVNDRLLLSLAADEVFFAVDDGIIIREELSQRLLDVLNLLVIDVKHLLWNHLFIESVFDWRLTCVLWDILLLLNNGVVAEELDPVLERWQDSVG